MRFLVDIWHPAHVHFFKNILWGLGKDGHDVLITARDKEFTLRLLDTYGFEYRKLSKPGRGILGLSFELLRRDYLLYKLAKNFDPQILLGIGGVSIAHVGKLLKKPSIVFTDTEHATVSNMLTFPFASAIYTPACFKKDLGRKQVKYNGYHELAYLHPDYFEPDPDVLEDLGVGRKDNFFILRLVSWGAAHDIGQRGMSIEGARELIKKLEERGAVFISSERKLPKDLQKHELPTKPEDIHSVLNYATMYVGEGATMATEAAILGTPSVFISPLKDKLGNFVELDQYGLVYSFYNLDNAMKKIIQLLGENDLKNSWIKKRKTLLTDKIDVTKFMIKSIIRYME